MKNIFDVDSNEIKRILSLHEESTKKQYLNIISEQTNPDGVSFTLSNDVRLENETAGQFELKLFKGTIFKIANKNLLYAKTNYQYATTLGGNTGGNKTTAGVIYYKCDTGKYSVKGKPETKYYSVPADNPGLNEIAKNLCQKSKSYVKPVTKPEIKKGEVKKGKVTKQPVNGQTFATQSTELTKQIQTSLGNTAPTGQITDTDLDLILTQLKQV